MLKEAQITKVNRLVLEVANLFRFKEFEKCTHPDRYLVRIGLESCLCCSERAGGGCVVGLIEETNEPSRAARPPGRTARRQAQYK
ncbi:hypothetical protein EVAR_37995_1 [Eumeta japonica]|uniref:Uncharacterized protein n=1 Tax=Eumeta variegata TaxID=151549 RepID=A0A4C1WYJ5_EUMVA|nr:hypothetical protein EVAR_37995_1 [Eumeta japonica]